MEIKNNLISGEYDLENLEKNLEFHFLEILGTMKGLQ